MKMLMPALLLLTLVNFACIPKQKSTTNKVNTSRIFSDRPQNRKQFITILKLKNPALLTTAKQTDGTTTIDENLKKLILAEQSSMITKLQQISSEIKILKQYQLVLNAIAILAPTSIEHELLKMSGILYVEAEGKFARAKATTLLPSAVEEMTVDLNKNNTIDFIGAKKIHKDLGITGKGMRVGIIDTGIDYTHSMFGGAGTVEAYKAIDPSQESSAFPNAKVVGGIDLVGTTYNANSPIFADHIPLPDMNPIDEAGHGTHVAGTVAGIGDGINTFSGGAPDADLYAIKVFGADGSVGDMVIISAFEYAADPNGDLNPSDKLDVVNLSLGGGYGKPHILYGEAIANLVKGGTVTVASAGNSGPNSYIVGAPSTVAEAISVAASIDGMDHNYKFGAVKFTTPSNDSLIVERIEGPISKPIKDTELFTEKLVFVGDASSDFTPQQIAALKDHVALIDRGAVAFVDKLERAYKAGAIGVVVANNQEGSPIAMGGGKVIDLPAIMITKALGDNLKEEMKKADVLITFKTDLRIDKPELIDNLTGFSSRGPRSNDSLLKPEISSPGLQIISAAMGTGDKGVKMNGTSMAAPNITSVMTLLKQYRNKLTPAELKSLLLNSAKTIANSKKEVYPISMQGAGRVQAYKAAVTEVISLPASISLGEQPLSSTKEIEKTVTLKNISDDDVTLSLAALKNNSVEIYGTGDFTIKSHQTKQITINFILKNSKSKNPNEEISGLVKFVKKDQEVLRIPFLAVVNKISNLKAQDVKVAASADDAAGAKALLSLKNSGKNSGSALIFNLLAKDERKIKTGVENSNRSQTCDLESAGYRIIKKKDQKGELFSAFQVAVKLYNPITTWQPCEISILFDSNGDNVADQELAGIMHKHLEGLKGVNPNGYSSILLDAHKMRKLRSDFEAAYAKAQDDGAQKMPEEDYTSGVVQNSRAIINMQAFAHSTVAVIEADLSLLAIKPQGEFALKVVVANEDRGAIGADDYLGASNKWIKLDPSEMAQSYMNLPAQINLAPGESFTAHFQKGEGDHLPVIYFPHNKTTKTHTRSDQQSAILKPIYMY